LTQLSLL